MIDQHLPAGATGRHHGGFGRALAGLRLADGDDRRDAAMPLDQRAAEGGGFGTDRKPADRGAEMEAGEDRTRAVAGGGGETMALGMKMLPECGERGLD